MEASVLDLRRSMRTVVEAIRRHEHITLTYHGKKFAIIVPYDEQQKQTSEETAVIIEKLDAIGMWADRADMKNPKKYVEKLRQNRRF